jgi:hypothetical protein
VGLTSNLGPRLKRRETTPSNRRRPVVVKPAPAGRAILALDTLLEFRVSLFAGMHMGDYWTLRHASIYVCTRDYLFGHARVPDNWCFRILASLAHLYAARLEPGGGPLLPMPGRG